MSIEIEAHDRQEGGQRLQFETLLADLSARFVNLPADQVDSEIQQAQRRVCECLGLDAGVLFQWEADHPDTLLVTHYYCRLDDPPIPSRWAADESFPWSLRQALDRRTVALSSTDRVPEGADRDQATWRRFGFESVLSLPLSAGGGPVFGVLSFCALRAECPWAEPLIDRLQLIAQVFANAVIRKHADQALRESEERLSLATEAAGASPWVLDAAGACFRVDARLMELLGLPPGERLEVERFMAMVHAEDRDRVREIMEQAMNTRELKIAEYRFVRPDWKIIWLLSRGRLSAHGTEGEPRLMGITAEITERKRRDEDLHSNEVRVLSAIEIAGVGFYEMDAEWRVTYQDERIKALAGIQPGEEDKGHNFWWAHVHPDDIGRLLAVTPEVVEGGRDHLMLEYRYLHPTLGLRWFHHLVRVQSRDANGRSTRIIGVIRDITEHENTENDLRTALDEVRQPRDRLQNENVYLREQIRSETGHGTIVGESESIRRMLAMARKVAPRIPPCSSPARRARGRNCSRRRFTTWASARGEPWSR